MNVNDSKYIVTYDPFNGIATPDGKCEDLVRNIISDNTQSKITTSSTLVIEHFRLAVVKKIISDQELVFIFNDKKIHVDKDGRFKDSIDVGFCDYYENVLLGIIIPN